MKMAPHFFMFTIASVLTPEMVAAFIKYSSARGSGSGSGSDSGSDSGSGSGSGSGGGGGSGSGIN